LLLLLYYNNNIITAFSSVDKISRDVSLGWLIRSTHLTGVNLLFLLVYLHFFRGLIIKRFRLTIVWIRGWVLIVLLIGAAFIGYVLPWGQMSLWGATVILNLVRVIPVIGTQLVLWVWGGFRVGDSTLHLIIDLHYLFPLLIIMILIIHLINLHMTGRSSSLGIHIRPTIIWFHPFYSAKDSVNVLGLVILIGLSRIEPWILGDADTWIEANPISSPIHIKPEWYFLWAYAILRAIPNKMGGVVILLMGVLTLLGFAFYYSYNSCQSEFIHFHFVWAWISIFITLTWLGGVPVEAPFLIISQLITVMFFLVRGIIVFIR